MEIHKIQKFLVGSIQLPVEIIIALKIGLPNKKAS
jgi:hypothetical protein